MQISVVIPTRNRRVRLLSLLANLNESDYPIHEVIVVDSSDEPLQPTEYAFAKQLNIVYLPSKPSVCIQRNAGIRAAVAPWVFLCDDDVEVPADYLGKLVAHLLSHSAAGAVSGMFLQQEDGRWTGKYPIHSGKELLLKFLFQLGIWGEVTGVRDNLLTKRLKAYYLRKGNHLSKSGWPVITHFLDEAVSIPAYTLGAALVRREWLLAAPFDEVLDRHGIGDNYGVTAGFPKEGLHLLRDAYVYHHHEAGNRLQRPLQYYRRALALDYFIRTKPRLRHIKRSWLLWSLFGNALVFLLRKDRLMTGPAFTTFRCLLLGKNPYYAAAQRNEKVVEPLLTWIQP